MNTNARSLRATRQILAFGGAKTSPVAFVEAIGLAPGTDKRARAALVESAVARILEELDPGLAMHEIAASFFDELPHAETPNPEDDDAIVYLRRRFKGTDRVRAYVPGEPDAGDDDSTIGPVRNQPQRRTLAELDVAAEVLAAVTLRSADLADCARAIGAEIRNLAARCRDQSTRSGVLRCAVRLEDAARAAGTLSTRPGTELIARAIARGANCDEAAAIEKFSAAHAELERRGLTRMSRERYVALNMMNRAASAPR